MSTTPQIRYSGPTIAPHVDWEIRRHLQLLYQKLGNHTQAFQYVADQLKKSGTSSTTTIIEAAGGTSGGGGTVTDTIGFVNNQTGATTYSTTAGDYGAILVFSDASPVAVSLTSQAIPWFCFVTNLGTGTATLTPQTGTINGSATLVLQQNESAVVGFDGTNYSALVVGGNTVISQVILSIDGGTATPSVPIVRWTQVPFAGTIVGWSITNCDVAGSLTCEVDKKASSAPPAAPSIPNTTTDKISASAPITLSAAQSASGDAAAVSTWTTVAVAQWDAIQFNVTAMSGITRANVALIVQRS